MGEKWHLKWSAVIGGSKLWWPGWQPRLIWADTRTRADQPPDRLLSIVSEDIIHAAGTGRQNPPNAAPLIFPRWLAGLYGIITIKRMEGKLEGQQALFCFWIALTHPPLGAVCVCVYVVQNTRQTLSSCHNTGQIPRCSRLVMRYCGFWTPALFSLLMPLPHPCLLRHSSLSRILRLYFNLISWKQLCSWHQSAATSGQSLQYALQASLSHFTALYSSPWYSSSRVCVLSLCVLSPEQGRVDQFARFASVTSFSLRARAFFPFPLFQLSQGNILTSGVCHLDLFRERECSLVAIARQTCRRSLGKLSYFES